MNLKACIFFISFGMIVSEILKQSPEKKTKTAFEKNAAFSNEQKTISPKNQMFKKTITKELSQIQQKIKSEEESLKLQASQIEAEEKDINLREKEIQKEQSILESQAIKIDNLVREIRKARVDDDDDEKKPIGPAIQNPVVKANPKEAIVEARADVSAKTSVTTQNSESNSKIKVDESTKSTTPRVECKKQFINLFLDIDSSDNLSNNYAGANDVRTQDICPNLKESCCPFEQLEEKLSEFSNAYNDFQDYEQIFHQIGSLPVVSDSKSINREEKTSLDNAKPESGKTEEEIIALFLSNLKLINSIPSTYAKGMSRFYSGFMCQICNPDSEKFFTGYEKSDEKPVLSLDDSIYESFFLYEKLKADMMIYFAELYEIFKESKKLMSFLKESVFFKAKVQYQADFTFYSNCHEVSQSTKNFDLIMCLEKLPKKNFLTEADEFKDTRIFLISIIDYFVYEHNFHFNTNYLLNPQIPFKYNEVELQGKNVFDRLEIKIVKEGFSMTDNKYNEQRWTVRRWTGIMKTVFISIILALFK